MKRKHKTYSESKKKARKWWFSLTPEQQAAYIESRQAKKAKERENMPERVLDYNPLYPWATEGVNDSNREQWQLCILTKNLWLRMI